MFSIKEYAPIVCVNDKVRFLNGYEIGFSFIFVKQPIEEFSHVECLLMCHMLCRLAHRLGGLKGVIDFLFPYKDTKKNRYLQVLPVG